MTNQQFHRIAAAAQELRTLAQGDPALQKALCELSDALQDVLCPDVDD